MGGCQPVRIGHPGFRQVESAVDKGVALVGHIGREHPDLAVGDLASRPRVLPSHTARGATLLQKACFINHQDRVVIAQMLDDVVADDVAQSVGIPSSATQQGLLSPRTTIPGCLSAHPPGLARFVSQQSIEELACRRGDTILREERPDTPLRLP